MLKLGLMGLSPGNGHPYSWGAIFNGYDKAKMAPCPFPVIPEYLAKVEPADFGIEGAKITHIWTQDKKVSEDVAGASRIENVVDEATDLIGKVDAIVLARDDGQNHLRMASPFIEEGIPILIDKPLADTADDLRQFVSYYEAGKTIMSCSSMRYADAIRELRGKLGKVLLTTGVCVKYWRTYGIHVVEGIYAVMGSGVETVQNVGCDGEEIVHLQYKDGRHAVAQTFKDMHPAIHYGFYGDKDFRVVTETSSYWSFKNMLVAYVEMLKTGKAPFDWQETVETIKVIVAGIISLKEGGRKVSLDEIL